MTYYFQEGERVPDVFRVRELESGTGRALPGPGGTPLILRIDEPSRDHVSAVQRGEIGLGVADSRSGSVFTVHVGDPEGPGYVRATVDVGKVEMTVPETWWGDDVEFGLCDAAAVCCETCRFVGPGVGVSSEAADPPGDGPPCVAVFPESGYGLVQPRGRLGEGDWAKAARALLHDPAWRPGFDEVWDLRFADETVLGATATQRLLDIERETQDLLAGSRTLAITTGRRALTLATRYYGGLVRPFGREFVVCATAAEAAERLGVEAIPTLSECEPGEPAATPAAT